MKTAGRFPFAAIGSGMLLAALLPIGAHGQDGNVARAADYSIDAEFFPNEGRMSATVDITLDPGSATGDTLVFYLHGELNVSRLELGSRQVEPVQELVFHENDYSNVANRVGIALDPSEPLGSIRVVYSGYFNPSVVGAISNYMRIDDDGVFLRSLGYSLWFPVFVETWRDSHEVSFSSVTIRTPEEYQSVFAGEFVRDYLEDGARITEWKADRLEIFDAQCTARRFDVVGDDGFRLYHLRDSLSKSKAGEILEFSRRIEAFFRMHYRAGVPTDEIHVMQMPRYGDIASGNVIGISDETWTEFEVTSWQSRTVAHELVHSFVRPPHSNELGSMVIEGFPSYLHLPVMAEILGEEWYESYMRAVEDGYLNKRATGTDRRGRPLPPEKPILTIATQEISTYKDTFVLNDRVRLFFDYLRRQLGSDGFFRLTADLLNRPHLDFDALVESIDSHLPSSGNDVTRWLRTTDFPEEFRIGDTN